VRGKYYACEEGDYFTPVSAIAFHGLKKGGTGKYIQDSDK